MPNSGERDYIGMGKKATASQHFEKSLPVKT